MTRSWPRNKSSSTSRISRSNNGGIDLLVTFVSGAAKFDQVGHLFTIEVERSAMTATVRIPTVLRPAMGGATTVPVEGTTIGAVLDHLTNDDDVRYLGGVDAPVLNNDEITLLPAVAGGAG